MAFELNIVGEAINSKRYFNEIKKLKIKLIKIQIIKVTILGRKKKYQIRNLSTSRFIYIAIIK